MSSSCHVFHASYFCPNHVQLALLLHRNLHLIRSVIRLLEGPRYLHIRFSNVSDLTLSCHHLTNLWGNTASEKANGPSKPYSFCLRPQQEHKRSRSHELFIKPTSGKHCRNQGSRADRHITLEEVCCTVESKLWV